MNDDSQKSKNVEVATSKFTSLCQTIEETLNEWHGEGNLQFPKLFGMIAMKLNWGESDVRKNDPLVRHYLQNHPEWVVNLGARGGVQRLADKERIEIERLAKKAERKPRGRKKGAAPIVRPEVMDEVRAEVEARVSSLETRAILTDEDEEEFGGEL